MQSPPKFRFGDYFRARNEERGVVLSWRRLGSKQVLVKASAAHTSRQEEEKTYFQERATVEKCSCRHYQLSGLGPRASVVGLKIYFPPSLGSLASKASLGMGGGRPTLLRFEFGFGFGRISAASSNFRG